MNPLPITPPATSHPRRRHQGPLDDNSWRSLRRHRRRRRRPPLPSLSATAAIITIMGLVVAWCRLPPPSSSPLSSNAAATLPTTESMPPHPRSPPPPCRRRALSALSIAHGAVMVRHAASMPSVPVQRGKCRSHTHPPCWATGPLHQRRHHSPSAGGIPSFTSQAAAAGQATSMAARRR